MSTTGIIPYTGKSTLAKIVGGLKSQAALYVGYGIGSDTPSVQDDKLAHEVERAAATVTNLTASRVQATHTFTAPYDLTVTEQALWDADGNMLYKENYYSGGGVFEEDDDIPVTLEFGVTAVSSARFSTAGITEVRDLVSNQTATPFLYIAYGTGTTAESAAHTALVTEVERVAADIQLISLYGPLDTLRYIGVFTQLTTAKTISEIGIFNDDTAGDMLTRKLLDNSVAMAIGDVPVVIYDIIFDYDASTV